MPMEYNNYYLESSTGKSNCVVRSFCKLYGGTYEEVFNELVNLAKELNCSSFNDELVFTEYMKRHDTLSIDYGKDIKVKDLELDYGSYIVFCYDKKDFYHMVPIIDNIIYDKNDECLDLYVISIYKQNVLNKKGI